MRPRYDTTTGQILTLPNYTQQRSLDPLTVFYPDVIPHGSRIRGINFVVETLDVLDICYTYTCTSQKLIPTHSGVDRERILNILKRSFQKGFFKLESSKSIPMDELYFGFI
jgi:hypothetical protein